jgi:2-haloacid dehalogenase
MGILPYPTNYTITETFLKDMIKTLFFDLNETLLDVGVLQLTFEEYFDHPGALAQWFTKLLFMSNTLGIVGKYKDFETIAEEALAQVFLENRKITSSSSRQEIVGKFRKLPAHKDVIPTLEWLKKKKIRCVVISNSTQEMIDIQLKNAGLTDYFDSTYSVEAVQLAKPFPDIYQFAAKKEKRSPKQIAMVASHDWDIVGAKNVGFRTGYIYRKQLPLNTIFSPAHHIGSELLELVKEIVAAKST